MKHGMDSNLFSEYRMSLVVLPYIHVPEAYPKQYIEAGQKGQ